MENLDKLLKIISNEYRYKIFLMLLNGEKCVCEIIPMINLSQPLVSYHINILKKSGLVKNKWIGRRNIYYINEKKLEEFKKLINETFTLKT
jgi:ArsR family transcriptional regulator